MSEGDWRNWSNHPLIVMITVSAALLSIYAYFEHRGLRIENGALTPPEEAGAEVADDVGAPPPSEDPAAQPLVGHWEGEGRQFNPRLQWRLEMDIVSERIGAVVGKIRYPSLRCGGQLNLIRIDASAWTMREDISYGLTNCMTGGHITVVPLSTNRAQWMWYYPQGELGAQAEISRSGH